jgi:haloalkane dehalogenase
MLTVMGSAPMREIDAWTSLLPRVTSTSFGVGRHLDAASRKAFVAGIGRQGVRSFHAYLHDARYADSLYAEIDRAFNGLLGELPLVTIFGERNDPLGFQAQWKQRFPDARQLVVPRGNHFPMCDDPDLVASALRDLQRQYAPPVPSRTDVPVTTAAR